MEEVPWDWPGGGGGGGGGRGVVRGEGEGEWSGGRQDRHGGWGMVLVSMSSLLYLGAKVIPLDFEDSLLRITSAFTLTSATPPLSGQYHTPTYITIS